MEKEQLISETIMIKSSNLLKVKNIDGYILYYLKNNYENICHNNGFVLPDSTELIQRSYGKVVSNNNQNYIQYNVNYKNKSIIPTPDDIFDCIVDSKTKMGIIGFLKYKDISEVKDSPILFIVPTEFIKNDKNINKGDLIKVKVLDTRIKFQSKQIQVVGEYVQ